MTLLGCIADDFTGATDLGSQLLAGGLRTVQWNDTPRRPQASEDVDAVVVALKSRSVPARQAIDQSLQALDALQQIGCTRFYFKYCSTFDSTPQGNIGPVAKALARELGVAQVVFCPAFPENGRTVYQGHLFVGSRLLNQSGMEHHPLNPMTDACLPRVLAPQCAAAVGLVPLIDVAAGPAAIVARLTELRSAGTQFVIADAIDHQHLSAWAEALVDAPLVTGGSALGRYLALAYRQSGLIAGSAAQAVLPQVAGRSAVIAGSCSSATQRQVAHFAQRWPTFRLDTAGCQRADIVDQILSWSLPLLPRGPVLIASTATPEVVTQAQAQFPLASQQVERTLSRVARGLVEQGVRRLVIAGGETSGAVLQELQIDALRIGPPIDPGVPWTETTVEPRLALALKSGNFGGDDLFIRALELLS